MATDPQIVSSSYERHDLPLSETFTIARKSADTSGVVTVELADTEGNTGIGGAGPSAYYGESVESVAAVLPDLLAAVEEIGDPHAQQEIERTIAAVAPEEAAPRAAVSLAVHDLAARQVGEPLYRRWGHDPDGVPVTSYTVGIDTPAGMRDRARRARNAGYQVLKVKLGTDADRERLDAVHAGAPDVRIRVDANCAWSVEEAIDKTAWLADRGVEFVEQPVAADDVAGLGRVSDAGAVPVGADESCVTAADVPAVADAVDVVVVKLMKCGGLRPALRQILAAQAHGLDVMLGCMTESNASIAGACHLAPLVEYADLDGALLLDSDPYTGVSMPDGQIDLDGVKSGTGARASSEWPDESV